MAFSHCERLTALDSLFLDLENHEALMHVGAVALFDAGPLQNDQGNIDFERIRTFADAAMHHSPRFRQKVKPVPVFGQPIWVDDERFNLGYHVRHTALPGPGSLRQLKRLVGRIMSQKLEREKPLWELWVVEGVEGGRVALIWKAHHCMVDGIAGIDLLASLLRIDHDASMPKARAFRPRPAPTASESFAAELRHRMALPSRAAAALPRIASDPWSIVDDVSEGVRAVWDTINAGIEGTTAVPFNTRIGPYRRYDWTCFDIDTIKKVRTGVGGTLNDVVLATAAGAIGRFLRNRGERVTRNTVFRVMVPVSIRAQEDKGDTGNRVVNILARLPIHEKDPIKRLQSVMATMSDAKGSRVAAGTQMFEELSDHTFTTLLVQVSRLAARQRAFNAVITNVPGPSFPVYLLGAEMREIYPVVPLFEEQGLGIALFGYNGKLFWGFNTDWDAMPDLHELVEMVDDEFRRLVAAATATEEPREESRAQRKKKSRAKNRKKKSA